MELARDLVYDIGANNGDDAAHYLDKGFRVLCIEADPSLIQPLQSRFADAITGNRLIVLNVALAPTRSTAQFCVCEGNSLWNSFDRSIAARLGGSVYSVELDCWPLRDLFERYGVPHFLKLSLHGQENFCLADIESNTAPMYLSLELPRDIRTSEDIFTRLGDLGYSGFKVIDQTTQMQLRLSRPVTSRAKSLLAMAPPLYSASRSLNLWIARRFATKSGEPATSDRRNGVLIRGWAFAEGSSGPFGEDTDGEWRPLAAVRRDYVRFLEAKEWDEVRRLSIWHDLHARRDPNTGAHHHPRP